jgi:hypothetical protein
MKRQPAPSPNFDLPIPHGDPLTVRIDLHSEGGGSAVYPYPTILDQLLGSPTGGNSRACQGPLKAHLGHDSAST